MTPGGVTFYYHTNAHGDVVVLANANGDVVATTPYGVTRIAMAVAAFAGRPTGLSGDQASEIVGGSVGALVGGGIAEGIGVGGGGGGETLTPSSIVDNTQLLEGKSLAEVGQRLGIPRGGRRH